MRKQRQLQNRLRKARQCILARSFGSAEIILGRVDNYQEFSIRLPQRAEFSMENTKLTTFDVVAQGGAMRKCSRSFGWNLFVEQLRRCVRVYAERATHVDRKHMLDFVFAYTVVGHMTVVPDDLRRACKVNMSSPRTAPASFVMAWRM